MLKSISLFTINLYQVFVSPILKLVLGASSVCRFDETCSNFTKRKIIEKGVVRGAGLGLKRLISCQPLTS